MRIILASFTIGPDRTFVIDATNDGSQPQADMINEPLRQYSIRKPCGEQPIATVRTNGDNAYKPDDMKACDFYSIVAAT